ncbi:hypothetical protein L1987_31009 [Smallanthus sonchifolius]|uniref:Uncharacterized protein n=1 Tax=Smallanthus sonchifolius TaxID=185202 RepID=A0ACB9I4E1_9ASTR|nr:hypothetical protein L1987_31009 [Smallanthus sonchifolius]
MMKRQKSGRVRDDSGERVVVIAVKASREISRNALIWALTHVVQPGDCAKLLVLIPAHTSSHKLWKSLHSDVRDQKEDITESCSEMILQLHNIYDSDNIKMKMKVISGTPRGVVAAEAKKTRTQWVVLDKKLKKEAKVCMEDLECNVVVIKKSGPKVLRLNLTASPTNQIQNSNSYLQTPTNCFKQCDTTKVPNVTPVSSPEHSSATTTHHNTSSLSSSELGFSPYLVADHDWDTNKHESDSGSDTGSLWTPDVNPITESLRVKFTQLDHLLQNSTKYDREMVVPIARHVSQSRALCSICQHKAPVFGTPPKWFSFKEVEEATDGFSEGSFLAEGGFGSVHRGVLKDGRMVAVKQHKVASSQGDNEFFSEVEVLSCAQHRNVVMLVGFCVEDGRRLLVYEYVCNGSLDSHLYGTNPLFLNRQNHGQLEWSARQKIAIGAARGLRYLHEECRVGCIVHRDMRPNNLLLTHDFEVLVCITVAVFPLSMNILTFEVNPDGVLVVKFEHRLEILDWLGGNRMVKLARPLLEENAIAELIDPRLRDNYAEQEVRRMSHCAWLCITRDPHSRPRMSQTVHEFEMVVSFDLVL